MATKPTDKKAPAAAPLHPPEQRERAAIEDARRRLSSRRPRFAARLAIDKKGAIAEIGPDHSDVEGWLARLDDLFGSNGRSFSLSQLSHILSVAQSANGYDKTKVNALLAAIEGAGPVDELQAMLAVQMAVTHDMAMQAMRRAMRVDQISQYDSAGNMAVKLMRTFTAQVEALAKLQRGGEQVVKVVHVHPGGQAVVGTVVTGTQYGEGGGYDEKRDQPHAKGELPAPDASPMPPVRSQDASRNPVPVACRSR
jgi:hypothetical protein